MPRLTRESVADAARYFDTWLALRQEGGRAPGVQAAVLVDDELVLSSAYGHADLEADIALTSRHRFHVASHSKTFTATAVFQLVDDGKLRLDDTVAHWLPTWASAPVAQRTVRELLGHGAGLIRDGWDGDYWQLYRPFPDETELRAMAFDRSDVLAANERFKYSNVGYAVLGMVVDAVSGQSYGDYVDAHIIDRLSLTRTTPDFDAGHEAEFATGYASLTRGGRQVPVDHVRASSMAAATGVCSTAEDLVRYAAAHFHGDQRLISDGAKRLMQRHEWKVPGTDAEYGLGFSICHVGGRRMVGHRGSFPGHSTLTLLDPVDRLAVSVLSNAAKEAVEPIVATMVKLVELAGRHGSADAATAERFTGRFATRWWVYDVALLGGKLFLIEPASDDPVSTACPLTVVDDTTLMIEGGSAYLATAETMDFTFGPDGVASVRGPSRETALPIERMVDDLARRGRITQGQQPSV